MRHKMKLIDANAFRDEIMNGWQYDIPDVIKTLRDFPVAYDIDNVIKELETEMQKKCPTVCFDDNYEQEIYDAYIQGMYDAFIDAIEIVKKGGKK